MCGAIAAAGLGVGNLPAWLADPEIAAGRLIELQPADPQAPLQSQIAWRNRQIGKALRWFLDELAKPATLTMLSEA